MSTITERVAAGAAFLDEHDPEWWREIDLDTLNLASSTTCVLGQRCPLETLVDYTEALPQSVGDVDSERYYAYGYALMRVEGDLRPLRVWAQDHGFNGDSGQFYDLTAEWTRVITERRAS